MKTLEFLFNPLTVYGAARRTDRIRQFSGYRLLQLRAVVGVACAGCGRTDVPVLPATHAGKPVHICEHCPTT